MCQNGTRRFTVIDVALLLVVVVLSVLVVYVTDRDYSDWNSTVIADRPWSRWPMWVHRWTHSASRLRLDAIAILGTLSVGLAGVSYRPRRYRLGGSGPGHIAMILSALIVLIWALMHVFDHWITPLIPLPPGTSRGSGPLFYSFWMSLSSRVAWTVTAAWITLALTGGWRSSVDWADRLGRWLGWAWVGTYLWCGLLVFFAIG